jgi:hypothetical protein
VPEEGSDLCQVLPAALFFLAGFPEVYGFAPQRLAARPVAAEQKTVVLAVNPKPARELHLASELAVAYRRPDDAVAVSAFRGDKSDDLPCRRDGYERGRKGRDAKGCLSNSRAQTEFPFRNEKNAKLDFYLPRDCATIKAVASIEIAFALLLGPGLPKIEDLASQGIGA